MSENGDKAARLSTYLSGIAEHLTKIERAKDPEQKHRWYVEPFREYEGKVHTFSAALFRAVEDDGLASALVNPSEAVRREIHRRYPCVRVVFDSWMKEGRMMYDGATPSQRSPDGGYSSGHMTPAMRDGACDGGTLGYLKKTPEQAAKDIKRVLLDKYLSEWYAAREYTDAREQVQIDAYKAAQDFAASLGLPISDAKFSGYATSVHIAGWNLVEFVPDSPSYGGYYVRIREGFAIRADHLYSVLKVIAKASISDNPVLKSISRPS